MLLITVTRLPNGYRIVATSTQRAHYYCWSLYRDDALLAVISRSYRGENSINFDLKMPLTPGRYALRVEWFVWNTDEPSDDVGYRTDSAVLPTIG